MLTDIDTVSTVLASQHWKGNTKEKKYRSFQLTSSWRLERNKKLPFELTFHIALEGLAYYSCIIFFFCWPFIDIDCSPRGSSINDYSILGRKKPNTIRSRNKQWQLKGPYAAVLLCTIKHFRKCMHSIFTREINSSVRRLGMNPTAKHRMNLAAKQRTYYISSTMNLVGMENAHFLSAPGSESTLTHR